MATIADGKTFSKRLDLLQTRLSRNRSAVLEGKDPEALHDFRVTLRRLRTLLGLMKGFYPSRRLEPVLSLLKKTTKSTNALRDQEVLCAAWRSLAPLGHPSARWEEWLRVQEDARSGQAKKTLELLASPDFARRLSSLPRKLAPGPNARKAASLISLEFKKRKKNLLKCLQKARGSKKGGHLLHKLRVEAKRVRYSLEEFGDLMPHRGRKLAAHCRKVQDALGEWRDLDRAMETLRVCESLTAVETRPRINELKAQKAACWREYKKAAKSLDKILA